MWLAEGDRVVLSDVPVPGMDGGVEFVSLELTRFAVTRPGTRFVVGDRWGEDVDLGFDVDSVVLLRGQVEGDAQSHVYLSKYRGAMSGRIELGSGERFVVTSRAGGGRMMPEGQALVLPDPGTGGSLPGCGVESSGLVEPTGGSAPTRGAARPGLFLVEVAVETDYELYEQFFDLEAEAAYIVQLYGAISDIYLRDVGTALTLSFVRVWDDPDDLFNEENPLGAFRDYWNANMEDTPRDVAQFLSGRANFWYGGIAYGSSVCGRNGYSVSGYTLGYFSDPERPGVYNRDIIIPAHELGHNFGTGHTQGYGLDTCNDPYTPAQRGPIMSYCGQTHTGGDANHDLRFHTVTAGVMRALLADRACVAADCNLNGIPDDEDIAGGTSLDVNSNGIPDECEDCNGNGVLDPDDIAMGTSNDINENGRPDECEPDCNNNLLPDDYDIETLISTDEYGNGVPDECETDCNGNGISDYSEINLDMSLDLDRDALLDSCEDCDGDGVIDLVALDGANDVWIADKARPVLRRFLSLTGTVVRDSADAGLAEAGDVLALPDGRVLATSMVDARVAEFGRDGAYLRDLVVSGDGGLAAPGAMLISPWGSLLIASTGTDSVKAYDPDSGVYLGDLVLPGAGGLVGPFGLAISPEGLLLVTSGDGRVLEFDAGSGVFVRELVSAGDNGGLDDPRGVLALADGRVLVASRGTNQVLEFDGVSGAFVRQFNRGGTADRMTLDQPWCIRVGPDGDIYVSRAHDHEGRPGGGKVVEGSGTSALHLTNARIYQFDVDSGKMVRAYVQSIDSGIERPTGFDFLRSNGTDCNQNLVPDSCDIATGSSADVNGDGVPDECQTACVADHDGNGVVDTRDLVALLNDFAAKRPAADINRDFVVDSRDVLLFLNLWGLGC
ncbi:MAG: M12 family metallo-peptidase [Planctomycetota bacterium]|nr:M12 family metallo-peptidase [Planctomycetota bacterium]